jgi:hypothetical protein
MVDSEAAANMAARVVGEVTSAGIVVGTLANLLPPLAALISICWIGFQFYNSEPFQKWLKKPRKDD